MYNYDRALVWRVRKVDIVADAAALAVDETLTPPTKSFAPLTDINSNYVDALTTVLATELARKHRREKATSDARVEKVPI